MSETPVTADATGGKDLLAFAIDAAGGPDAWARIHRIRAHAAIGGTMWGRKGHPDLLADVQVQIDPHRQWVSYAPFGATDRRSIFEPDQVRIERTDGTVLAERLDPRASFAGHDSTTLWDELHVAYFSGYAIWTYLTTPFLLALPGVSVHELTPWPAEQETWRRLHATFPASLATHSREQTFYFDSSDGLLRRHDYAADVFGGVSTANFAAAPNTVGGITLSTRRWVVPRAPDGTTATAPVLVAIDLDTIETEP